MSGVYLPPLDTSKPFPTPVSPTRRHQVTRSISEFSSFPKLHRQPHNRHDQQPHVSRNHKEREVAQSTGPNLQVNGEVVGSMSDTVSANDSKDASRRTSVLVSGWDDGERVTVREIDVVQEKEKASQRAM